MHYTNILQLAENKTYALHKYLTGSKEYNLHYTNILQLAKNKTCTTQISYSWQRIKYALHKIS